MTPNRHGTQDRHGLRHEQIAIIRRAIRATLASLVHENVLAVPIKELCVRGELFALF